MKAPVALLGDTAGAPVRASPNGQVVNVKHLDPSGVQRSGKSPVLASLVIRVGVGIFDAPRAMRRVMVGLFGWNGAISQWHFG